MSKRAVQRWVLQCTVAGALCLPLTGSPHEAIEEIAVTARKREEALRDVPISITALAAAELAQHGTMRLERLANAVAGFTAQNLGPGRTVIAMRGLAADGSARAGIGASVGLYLDESDLSLSPFAPDLDFYDFNRVEILRGPQDTLYGADALGGVVRYITHQPTFSGNDYALELGYHRVEAGESGLDVKGMLNLPLTDSIAFRGVAYHSDEAGFIDALSPDGTIGDVNGVRRSGARLALAFEPHHALRVTPRLVFQQTRAAGFNRVDAFNILAHPFTTTRPGVVLGELEQYAQIREGFDDRYLLLDTTAAYQFPRATLTSITAYRRRDIHGTSDATALAASITAQPDLFNLSADVYTLPSALDEKTQLDAWTQELRLTSRQPGRWQWLVGLILGSIDRDDDLSLQTRGFEAASGIATAGPLAPTDVLFVARASTQREQLAWFGEASYDLSQRMTLSAGLRYADYKKTRSLAVDGLFTDRALALARGASSKGASTRVGLSYAANDSVTLNAAIAEGFRPGGINDPLNPSICSATDLSPSAERPTFADEQLRSYEIGIKSTVLGGAGVLNAAAFRADIENFQTALDGRTCFSRATLNVPRARTSGLELELSTRPVDALRLSFSGSWIDAKLRSTVHSTNAAGGARPLPGIEAGNRLPTVPKVQFAASGTLEFNWSPRWPGFVSGTLQYVGSRYTQLADQAAGFGDVDLTITPIGHPSIASLHFEAELPAYDVAHIRIGARRQNFEVALYVDNVWDERAVLALDLERGGRARVGYLVNRPRTIGVTTRFTY